MVLHTHPSQRPLFCFPWFKQDKKTKKPHLPTPQWGTFAWHSAVCGSNPTKQSALTTSPKQPLPHSPTLPTPFNGTRVPKSPRGLGVLVPITPLSDQLPQLLPSPGWCRHQTLHSAGAWMVVSPKARCEKAGKEAGSPSLGNSMAMITEESSQGPLQARAAPVLQLLCSQEGGVGRTERISLRIS